MKTVVIYKTVSGFTKRYAEWIAQELKADIFKHKQIKPEKLLEYDTIIYGGSLHAVGITGIKLIKKNMDRLKDKNVIIFTTGASAFKESIIDEISNNNFDEEEKKKIRLFYFRGGFDIDKLDWKNKLIMNFFKLLIKSKRNKTLDEKGMLDSFSNPVDFTEKENINGLIEYANSLK